MPIPRVRSKALRSLLTMAFLASALLGCTLSSPKVASRGTDETPTAARTQKTPSNGTSLPSAFGETEQVAEIEPAAASASPIRQSAWAKLKGAISRPQPIPLPGGDAASVTEETEQQPFPTVDGRDF